MSSLPILDLVVGMVFLYFLLSIICSSVVEIVLSYFKLRSQILSNWLHTIFDKKMLQPDGTAVKLGQAITDHCVTTGLSKPGKATSFIDAKNFSSALIEKLTFNPDDHLQIADSLDKITQCMRTATSTNGTPLLSTELQRTFLNFAAEAQAAYHANATKTASDIQIFKDKLEHWFDSSQDRLEGSLKTKYTRPLTFWLGIVIVFGLNADSIALSKYLYSNPDARAKLAAQGTASTHDTEMIRRVDQMRKTGNPDSLTIAATMVDVQEKQLQVKKDMAALQDAIPLGWQPNELNNLWHGKSPVFSKLAGLLATVLAVMLGAPFWFDLLNKIANLRGSGPKPASKTDPPPKK